MKRVFQLTVLCVLLSVTGCSKEEQTEPNLPNLRPLSITEKAVVESSNEFAFDITARVNTAKPDSNVFLSPFSISTALSMTLNGAESDTETAMKEALGLNGMTDEEINTAYKDLVDLLLDMDATTTLEAANSVWYKDQYSINSAFSETLNDYYDASVFPADFSDPALVDDINGWIEDKTHDRIQDMLGAVPSSAVMYLINAIYFKAEWASQFDESLTQDETFYLTDGSAVQIPTMYSENVELGWANNEDYSLVDIPYGNGQFRFTAVMPNNAEEIVNLAETFTNNQLSGMLADTTQLSLPVYMPKFKIEFKELLNDVLTDMGMGIAFGDSADFSDLFDESLSLAISRVIHQSFLEVNEEGSEAAAATIVGIVETSVGPTPQLIKLDKPFLFFIRESHTNTILFSGKLMNPLVE